MLIVGIILVASISLVLYETTKKTVILQLNGEEQIVKTHAKTVNDLFEELDISLHSKDFVTPSVTTTISDQLEIVWVPAKQVKVVVGNEEREVWTTAKTVEELLKEENISLSEYDKVQPTLQSDIKENTEIIVDRAFILTLKDGGEEKQVWSTSTTVADFLSQQGITLNELDRVEPSMDTVIKENDTVNIVRVEKVTDVVEEPIQFAVITKKDNSLTKGTEKVVQKGQEGLVQKEYEVVLENGKEVSRTLVKETKVRDKKDKVVAVGTKEIVQTVSRGSGNVVKEFYVTSTAYTAYCNGCSGVTTTGVNLRANPNVKVIAVDPSVIPLGTKVYVEGYGYAVAADTGSAIKGNKIDVFFPSKTEAYRWGIRKVKIKILD